MIEDEWRKIHEEVKTELENQLHHKLEIDGYFNIVEEIYESNLICKICNTRFYFDLRVFYDFIDNWTVTKYDKVYYDFSLFKRYNNELIKLTCEEFIIKNIIE